MRPGSTPSVWSVRTPCRKSRRHALVLAGEHWHQGVVGIVASRLAEKYACPAFMICLQDGKGKGSCRSFAGFNLFAALEHCAPLLEASAATPCGGRHHQGGEHPAFAAAMNDYVCAATGGREMVSVLDVDGELDDPACSPWRGWRAWHLLEPYGAGNPKPVFSLSGCLISAMSGVGGGRHLKLKLSRRGPLPGRHLLLRHRGGGGRGGGRPGGRGLHPPDQ